MKKIFMTASLVAGITLITSCSVKLTEDEKNSDYNNTIHRGMETHNFTVIDNKINALDNKLDKVLDNKLDKVLENQEIIIDQNKEMLEILRKQ